jgi:hypothetical protein
MSKAQSKISNYWIGFKSKSPFSIIGLIFIILAIFVLIPLLFILDNLLKEPYERYNYKEIVRHGEIKNARITGIKIKTNVRFNDINPRVISYAYMSQGSIFTDKFQTVDIEQVDSLSKKDSIIVFVWNGESVIHKIKPYTFPTRLLLNMPMIFLFIGIPMACLGHLAGMRNIRY